ncbi:MAG: Smr/MutS family protein [Verrucomicrobiota bacterium]|jgi:dsDNA-specific endonuclease/ATPase MutS2|nr:Smr/MutS family protein [Verrucomicrobiota bacterium]|tara:strand:+ start:795 stop:1097 length:303 start_codon:yes stop_codon:yes gene_type:complete
MSDGAISDETFHFPITSEIDLHTFRPSEVSSLLREYIKECRKKNILSIRIIHGKGTGALREGVHKLLDQLSDEVDSYTLGNETTGGWGATVASLKKSSKQ